jgi:ferredoxin-NADP reductase/MOSC domain-containing protein YiiM
MASLLSVNVGLPANISWQGRTVFTGIWKGQVDGPRMVRRLNVDGDGQGDLAGHGGEQRAVMVYQIESYQHWQQHFDRDDFEYGQFGENFTVEGLSDNDVCIGDRYRIGEAEFEVTQPRVTCFRVGMRLGEPTMPSLLVSHHRPGFYLRVITEGYVAAGDEIVRTRIGRHALSVADVDALLYLPDRDIDALRQVVEIPALSPGWRGSFQTLLEAAESGKEVDAPSLGIEPGWTGFRPLRVAKLVVESSTVTSVYLETDDGTALPSPVAGQFLAVRVSAAGQPPPVRSYSLSTAGGGETYRISVKREPKGVVSGFLNTNLTPGSVLEAAAPRGAFHLTDGDEPVLLISAGIGVTPVLAMLHQLATDRSARDVWWIYTTRSVQQHAFADESRELLRALPNAHERIYYTADAGRAPRSATITSGRLTAAALAQLGLPANASAYVCGPPGFMSQLRDALIEVGVAPEQVHTEVFGTLPSINPGIADANHDPPHQPAGPAGTGPLITFARSGLSVPSSQRFASLLELAEACDVPTRWSCRSGVCHTCETPILSGTIEYASPPLEPPAPDQVLICSAVAGTDLVLDL